MSIRSFFKRPGAEQTDEEAGQQKKKAKTSLEDGAEQPEAQSKNGSENSKQAAIDDEKLEELRAKVKNVKDAAACLPASWAERLGQEVKKPYFQKLNDFVAKEIDSGKIVFPPLNEVFSALYLCPFDKVKVVVVGQDPYHGPNQAHGLSFSVKKGVPPPPSLVNMYKELKQDPDVKFEIPKHGCLTKWAEQGVLMLNACLTVRKAEANSHQKQGWETFTDAIISELNKNHKGLIFLLWGKPAENKCKSVDKKKHFILTAPHPSPLSAHRGFFGCHHFSKANQLLETSGRTAIDWQLPMTLP
mmetsp:Transcript_13280/g.20866  ORF Transcript_13280/g.20866 Transcript_13280/m.20866 type:complete len:301 (+) Transcript_13280:147-1049(+)